MRALCLIAALLFAVPAYADGTVLRAKGCGDKVFVFTENGYSVLIANQPGAAVDGDKLVGNTDRLGFSSFLLPESGRRFSASVDARGISKAEVTARIAANCRAAAGAR